MNDMPKWDHIIAGIERQIISIRASQDQTYARLRELGYPQQKRQRPRDFALWEKECRP